MKNESSSKILRRSRTVGLVLLGATAIISCSSGSSPNNGWGGSSTNRQHNSGIGMLPLLLGGLGGSRGSQLNAPPNNPQNPSSTVNGVSRGGFGSTSSYHSTGG